jgi:ribosomal protein S18 acetylase RimI-like enzyme
MVRSPCKNPTMTSIGDIRCATLDDVEWMAVVASRAFAHDELWNYLVGGNQWSKVADFHRQMLAEQIPQGHVTAIRDIGWAAWMPPEPSHATDRLRMRDIRIAFRIFGRNIFRARALKSTLGSMRSAMPSRHWYLDTVVVDPSAHGQGIGSRLVRHSMDIASREGSGCYLEATGNLNQNLYLRLGFKPMQVAHFTKSLTVTGMWADPKHE